MNLCDPASLKSLKDTVAEGGETVTIQGIQSSTFFIKKPNYFLISELWPPPNERNTTM